MSEAWKRLSSGKYIDLNNLTVADIDIGDINTSLNNTVRFNGHWKDEKPLTVAQHTDLCLRIAEKIFPDNWYIHLAILIHDFGEAYYGDIATPVKRALGQGYRDFAEPIDNAIEEKFWYRDGPIGDEIHEAVKICDLLSLDMERRSMWSSQFGKDKWPTTPSFMDMSVSVKKSYFDLSAKKKYVDLEAIYNDLVEKLRS